VKNNGNIMATTIVSKIYAPEKRRGLYIQSMFAYFNKLHLTIEQLESIHCNQVK
jgi:hypothetical protein